MLYTTTLFIKKLSQRVSQRAAAVDRNWRFLEVPDAPKRVSEDVTGRSESFIGGNAGLDERFYDLYYDVNAVSIGPPGMNLHGADERTTVPALLETATAIASIAVEYCGGEEP